METNIQYEGKEMYIGFAKQPLMPGPNKGFLGVKMQNKERTKIMCNECGGMFKRLHPTHLKKHGLTFLEYKRKHGYSKTDTMCADSESLHMSKKILGKPHSIQNNEEALIKREKNHKIALEEGRATWINSNSRQNQFGSCYEQVKDRLRNYIDRYHQLPTYRSIGDDGKALFSLLKHRYKDVNKGFQEYDLPTKKLFPGDRVEYTFKDGTVIYLGYKHSGNWEKLYKKIIETSDLFKQTI